MNGKKITALGAALAVSLGTLGISAPASAQSRWDHDGYGRAPQYERYDRDYRDYRPYRGEYRRDVYVYRGGPGGYYGPRGYDRGYDRRYYRCDNDGTAGTIIGAIAGGLLGNAAAGRRGDRTTGTIIGGAVGAVAGRAIDRSDSRCR